MDAHELNPASVDSPLIRLGGMIRFLRERLGLSRTSLAERSGLSLRFLAQLESGKGNISYLRLRKLAGALETDVAALIRGAEGVPSRPVSLLGMRGAGKSTVGGMLARRLGIGRVELDERVETEAGMPLAQIFELQGEAYYRQLEREALVRFLDGGEHAVLVTGGGIVTEPETFSMLRERTFTVWLKAAPRDHWDRVLAQGDRRPMRNRSDAMRELDRLWTLRSGYYAQADVTVDTSHRPVEEVVREIEEAYSKDSKEYTSS
jgi:XRE family aerobic/anaerobic benzoate catabolism transcriptional regulator